MNDPEIPALPLPSADVLTSPFWAGLREHRLLIQSCSACGASQHPPEVICRYCQSRNLDYLQVEPDGVVYSWTRVWHPVHEKLVRHVPYVIVVVELAAPTGIQLLGGLIGSEPVRIGAQARGVFTDYESASGPLTLLHWRTVRSPLPNVEPPNKRRSAS